MKTNGHIEPLSPKAIDELFLAIGETTRPRPTTSRQHVSNAPHRQRRPEAPVTTGTARPEPPSRLNLPKASATWRDWVPRAFVGLCLVCAAFCFLYAVPNSPLRRTTIGAAVAKYIDQPRVATRSIQDFDVGMRAIGENPLRDQVETAPEPDPETSRKLVLRMTKESGHGLHIKLLRPLAWVEMVGATKGSEFYLELPEMGAVGDAYVEAILPCPLIEEGPGNVVTGVFAHEADPETKILSVTFSNGAHLKGVTDNHPFYSVDRNAFIEIGEMREGDLVKVEDGATRIARIESRFARPGEMLYNLETHNEHVFQVSMAGVLVHNSCITDIRFRGARSIDSLRAATHHDLTKAFSQTGFKPSNHFISRVKDIRTERLGLRTFNDLEGMFRNGHIVNTNDGLKALVHGDMAIVFNPNTNVLVTLTPW